MSKYRGPQLPQEKPVTSEPSLTATDIVRGNPEQNIAPAPLGFLPNRPRRFLCFECLSHPPFLSREELKAHMEGGHQC